MCGMAYWFWINVDNSEGFKRFFQKWFPLKRFHIVSRFERYLRIRPRGEASSLRMHLRKKIRCESSKCDSRVFKSISCKFWTSSKFEGFGRLRYIYIYHWTYCIYLDSKPSCFPANHDCVTQSSKGRKWWEGLKPQRLLSERGDRPASGFHLLDRKGTTSIELMWCVDQRNIIIYLYVIYCEKKTTYKQNCSKKKFKKCLCR